MFKFEDTEVVDKTILGSSTYVLAHSEQCGAEYGTPYTLRHYPEQQNVQPYMDEAGATIDFTDFASALNKLSAFPIGDGENLTRWLGENLI